LEKPPFKISENILLVYQENMHVACMGDRRGAYRALVGKPEGRRPLGRPRPRWKNNIKRNPTEVRFRGMDWISLAEDRDGWRALANAVMNFRVP
jgi:hypothetical protein